jgi:VanZ family protein
MLLINRVAAWVMVAAIVALTVVPPGLRPITAFPHGIEHAFTFLAVGILFGMAYIEREWILGIGVVVFCAAIEILQLYVPGRHARISDFVIDSAAGIAGVFLVAFVRRLAQGPASSAR